VSNACGNTVTNQVHNMTYTLSGQTLTLTEANTPADNFGCMSKMEVCTLTKQ
jgi:hypothetical protein